MNQSEPLLIMARLSRKRKIKSKSMASFKVGKEYNSNAPVFAALYNVFGHKKL
jgi:hypothetical protein